MGNIDYQKLLFGDRLESYIPEFRNYIEVIDTFLEQSCDVTATVNITGIKDTLMESEKILANIFKSYNNDLHYLNLLIQQVLGGEKKHYLSEEKIEEILRIHPPNKIIDRSKNVPLSNREMLTLTRFTEDDDWQKQYLSILSKTSALDYTESYPLCTAIDAKLFKLIANKDCCNIKPWRVSHSKETGVIIFFKNHPTEVKTPYLLLTLVFLHYLFEVNYFADFIHQKAADSLGKRAVAVILAKDPGFPFLTDGNAHDETLYWQKGLAAFEQVTKIKLPRHLVNSFIISNGTVQSVNVIDVVWGMNKINQDKNVIYHLQQDLWYKILKSIFVGGDFETIVKRSLTHSNVTFMRKVLNYSGENI